MSSQDLHSNIKTQVALHFVNQNPITTDPILGTIIDTCPTSENETGYESIEFIWVTGVVLGALGEFGISFKHGDQADLSDAEVVDSKWLIGNTAKTFKIDENHKTNRIGYVGKKRYIRCQIDVISVGSEAILGVVAVLSNPRNAPRPPEYPIT